MDKKEQDAQEVQELKAKIVKMENDLSRALKTSGESWDSMIMHVRCLLSFFEDEIY